MNRGFSWAGWALAGGAVGSTLVYLTAPASGVETRRRIGRRIADETNHLARLGQRAVGHAIDYLEDQLRQGKRKLSHVVAR
jgi:gas vesicle protein